MTDAVYVDDQALHINTPAYDKCLLNSLEQVAGGIGLNVNAKTVFKSFKGDGVNS